MPRTPKFTVALRSYIKRLLCKEFNTLTRKEWHLIWTHCSPILRKMGLTKNTAIEEIAKHPIMPNQQISTTSTVFTTRFIIIQSNTAFVRDKCIEFLDSIVEPLKSRATHAPATEKTLHMSLKTRMEHFIQMNGNMSPNNQQLLPFLFVNAPLCKLNERHVVMVGCDPANTTSWRLIHVGLRVSPYDSSATYNCLWIEKTGNTFKTSCNACPLENITLG